MKRKNNKYFLFSIAYVLLILCFCSVTSFAQTKADFTINKNAGCVPLSGVNFTDASSGGTVTGRKWDLGNGNTNNTNQVSVGTNYLTDGKFYVVLTVTFSNGEVRTKTDSIIVHPKPIADFTVDDAAGCLPHNVNFKSLSTTKTGTVTEWAWDFDAGTGSGQTPAYNYTLAGDYNISLLVKNSWGCESDAATKAKYVHAYNKAEAAFTTPVNYGCDTPFNAKFVNNTTGGGIIAYQWDFGDGQTSTDVNPAHNYIHPGIYKVTLTAKNGKNCSSSFATTYKTNISAGKPKASVQAGNTVCINTSASFTANATPASFLYTVKWLFPDTDTTQEGPVTTHVFSKPGNFDVMMIAGNYVGCNDTVKHTILVRPGPATAFTVDRAISCDTPFSVKFTDLTVPSNGLSYDWDFGDASAHSNQKSPAHIYTMPGNYSVMLTLKDTAIANGCSAFLQKKDTIRIVKPKVDFFYVPPGGCGPLPVKATAALSDIVDPVVQYIWDFADGPPVTTNVNNTTHIYNSAGNYSVRLKVVTQKGCTDSSAVKPVKVLSICDDDGSGDGGGNGFVIGKNCADKYSISMTDTVKNTSVISWDFGDGSPLYTTAPLNTVTHKFPSGLKKYIVTVSRQDNTTGALSSSKKNIIIIDEHADFSPDITNICIDKLVNFSTIGIDSSKIKTYTWDYGDGTARSGIDNKTFYESYGTYLNGNSNHTYAVSGTYYVKLVIEDKVGCLDSFSYAQPVIVKGPRAGFSGTPLNSCDGDFTVAFTDTSAQNGSTKIVEWSWNFGDGSPDFITTEDSLIHHQYSSSRSSKFYKVFLKVKDAIGCESEVTKPNYIRSYKPKADFISSDTLKCGNSVQFENKSAASNGKYQWFYGDNTSSSGDTGLHSYSTGGIYDIKLVVTDDNGCKDSITKPGYIKIIKPKADYLVGDSSKCSPVAIRFADNSGYAETYEWDFDDGSAGSADKNPAPHLYTVPGFYNVKLIVKGGGGCVDSITKQIRVKGPIGKLTTGSVVGCAPYSISMEVNGTNVSTYAWDYADGTPVNEVKNDSLVNHLYTVPGKYFPNVVLTSPEGCSFTLKVKDTLVVDIASVDFKYDKAVFCDSGLVQFTGKPSTADFSSFIKQEWNFGDGTTFSQPDPPLHNYNSPGKYDVSFAVETQYGCKDTLLVKNAISINKSPYGNIAGDSLICLSPSSILNYHGDIVSDDTIISYKWKIDAVNVSNDSVLSINYRKPGTHNIRLDLKTLNGCSTTVSKAVVIDSVTAGFTVIAPLRCGNNRSIDFTNNSYAVAGIDNFLWQFGDGETGEDVNPRHDYISSGVFNVNLIAQSNAGCRDTFSLPQPLEIFKTPVLGIDGLVKACTGLNTYASNISEGDSVVKYTWALKNDIIGNGKDVNYVFTDTGNYRLSLSVNTLYGCVVQAEKNITVGHTPVPKASAGVVICAGSSVQLSAEDGDSYSWLPSINIEQGNSNHPVVTPLQDTRYFVTVTNQYGCTGRDSVDIKVDQKVNLKPGNDAGICRGSSINLSATANTQNFLWSPADGLSNTAVGNPVASPAQTTTYQVIGYSNNTCANDTGFVTVRVGDAPFVKLGADTTLFAGDVISLAPASVSGNVTGYLWQPSAGLSCSNCAAPVLTADKNITYRLVVTSQDNCKATDTINITVLCGKGAVRIPGAFTPNGDGLNDVFCITGYGIQKVKSFRIFDRWGRMVFNRSNIMANDKSNGWNGMFNGKQAPSGSSFVYIAEVECNEGKAIQLKGTVVLIN